MKTSIFRFSLFIALLISFQSVAQYGYGGGYGGGYGRRNSAMNQMPQTPRKPLTSDQIAEEQTKWMTKKLKLTEDQAISIEMANLDHALNLSDFQEAYMKTHANTRPSPQEIQQIRATVDKWQTEKEAKFKTILTPEQWEIYEKKKKGMPHTTN
jgi:hypothetical protein